MYKLVLLRHGQSQWNLENKFTGWTDVELSKKGIQEAKEAGQEMKKKGFTFDIAFTSVLKRAKHTLSLALGEMGIEIPVTQSWRLNERMYGALQGINKSEKAKEVGEEQVHIWRRSYDTKPPQLTKQDLRYPGKDPLYKDLKEIDLPIGESLEDALARILPFWNNNIVPVIKEGKNIIICAHGTSLRGIVMFLDKLSHDEILHLNIPTGIPLVYELDENLKPIKHYYLADDEKVKAEQQKVKDQGKAA